jgi:signal transduction histidine kinase
VPPGVELASYRIVQEATTNALKHAVGATRLLVELNYHNDAVGGSVCSDGRLVPALLVGALGTPVTGHALAGRRQRARFCNGIVAAGPCPDGRSVSTSLEVTPTPAERAALVPTTEGGPSCCSRG